MEDRDGNIWIGAENGLSRYDGKGFVNFTNRDDLAGNSVSCIHQDRDGNIWIGTWGSGVSRYDNERFVNFTDKDGLAGNDVSCIHQDRDGNIWFGTGDGLSRYDGKEFINFTNKDGLADNDVSCIHQDRDGNIWIGTWGSGVSKYDGKGFINFTTNDGLANNNVGCIYQDKKKNLWIGTWGNGVSKYDGKGFVNFTDKDGLADNDVSCIHQDIEGNMWFGIYRAGASCYDGTEFITFDTKHGLASNQILDITQDKEGNIWFACGHGGISKYNPYEILTISDECVNEVMIKDRSGNLWWGSRNILSEFDGKKINHYLFENEIMELFEDSKGQLWVGTRGGGVFRYDNIKDLRKQKPINFTEDNGLVNNEIWRIREDIQGNIWIGTWSGLSRYDGREFVNFTTDDGLGSNLIPVIFQDKSGMLWFGGFNGGGITSYDGKSFHRYTTDDGLVDDRVVSIIEDDKNNLWIGTLAGISCYNGRSFRNYTTEDGLLSRCIQGMMQDSKGHIWVATLGGGVSRFDGENLQALTADDGLPSNNVTGVIEDSDGSMIISTYKGICRYTPDPKTPPVIQIDEVDAGRVYRNPKDIKILESASSVRIGYHGISFKTKRMRYSYILEGYDKEWKATWHKGVRYQDLPAGKYTFKVIAINKDLIPSEKPAELKLSVIVDPRNRVINELEGTVREAKSEISRLRAQLEMEYSFDKIIGKSRKMQEVYALMKQAIESDITVLIQGKSGTGKELVAKAIHFNSSRKNGPFVAINCAAIPEDLFESEFFGYERGAFSGAITRKIGKFEQANGGTILLDEITEMHPSLQAKLLRVLQEKEIQRIGGTTDIPIDIRIMATTNRNLDDTLKSGILREDLFYRLSAFPIVIPPLRDRREDIPLLVEHFLKKHAGRNGKLITDISNEALQLLMRYSWPGNVRELGNVIERVVLLEKSGVLQARSISLPTHPIPKLFQMPDSQSKDLTTTEILPFKEIEKRALIQALEMTGNSTYQAAQLLGIDRSTIYRKLKRYNLLKF